MLAEEVVTIAAVSRAADMPGSAAARRRLDRLGAALHPRPAPPSPPHRPLPTPASAEPPVELGFTHSPDGVGCLDYSRSFVYPYDEPIDSVRVAVEARCLISDDRATGAQPRMYCTHPSPPL